MERGSIAILSPWPSVFSMGAGGTPRVRDLVETLLAAGYSVDFFAPTAPEGDWVPTRDRLQVHRFAEPRRRIPGYVGRWIAWLELTIRLTARILGVARRQRRPRVIYALSSLTIPGAVLSGAILRRPTIGALFGTFLFPHLERKLDLLYHFEERIAFSSPVDRLVITNDGTRGDDVARALGVPAARVRFWINGLDFESVAAAIEADGRLRFGLASDVPVVVWASRLTAWKRVDRLLRAAPDVLAVRPDALFVIAGDGPERQTLEGLVRRLGIENAVRFLGALPRDENLELIASANVFCSLYDYSCVGVALLEALACAAPVVVADTGATRDFVEDGVNGLVVSTDDTRATSAAIVRLIEDPDLRARLGTNARERALERFPTREERASLELGVIAELAGSSTAPPGLDSRA